MIFLFATFFSFDTARLDTQKWVNKQCTTSEEGLIQTSGPPVRYYVINIGILLGTLYCVVDTGSALGRSPGDCKPALPEGPKYQMVKT